MQALSVGVSHSFEDLHPRSRVFRLRCQSEGEKAWPLVLEGV
jgi:hypothetical protein